MILPAILIFVSLLGFALICVLIGRTKQLQQEKKLNAHRRKEAGLADLLNYAAMIDDGVILNKNASFTAAWMYRGNDNASATVEQRNKDAAFINQALSHLGAGWMFHIDNARREAPAYPDQSKSHFGDEITAGIESERRNYFTGKGTLFEGYFVLTVTYYPPSLAEQKFVELMFDDERGSPDAARRSRELLAAFNRDCETLESKLGLAMRMTRLRSTTKVEEGGETVTYCDLLRWLQFCVTGVNQPIALPSTPMYLDMLIGSKEFWSGTIPKLGRKYIQTVAIDGFPSEAYPGILNALTEVPCVYRWSTRFIFVDPHDAISALDKFRKSWNQKVRPFMDVLLNRNTGRVDTNALEMARDADDAIAEVNSGLVRNGYYTSVVVLMDEDRDRLANTARQLAQAIEARGFGAREETINNQDAFFGSLPAHGVENVRRPLISTMNLAHLMPLSSIWTGSATAPCPFYPPASPPLMHCVTHGATPFRLNLHVADVGHTLILGPTGAGKSTLLGIIAAQFRRYEGMQIFAFEKGRSLYPLTAAINATTSGKSGIHIDAGAESGSGGYAPLQHLNTREDRTWAMNWIDMLLALNGVNTTPTQRVAIGQTIQQLHQSGQESNTGQTLSDFLLLIQDDEIRTALQIYAVDGPMGHLLDEPQDSISLSDFTVFEIEELMGMGDKFALPVLTYLFRRIERSLTGRPTAIILDEAWIMLANPAFRSKINEWLKVLRKANCVVVMATQQIGDAAKSGIFDVIIESCPTRIFLPNAQAKDEEMHAVYRRAGLNARQVDIIAAAVPKRQYYVNTSEGSRLIELALGPYTLAFVGRTDKESVEEIIKLRAQYGNKWVSEWLDQLKINSQQITAAA